MADKVKVPLEIAEMIQRLYSAPSYISAGVGGMTIDANMRATICKVSQYDLYTVLDWIREIETVGLDENDGEAISDLS